MFSAKHCAVSSLGQKSRRSFGELHKALTKAEHTPLNIVEFPAWPKNSVELLRDAELRPRLNVLCQPLWSLQVGSKIWAELQQVAQSCDQG
jgi:hypothetical protein